MDFCVFNIANILLTHRERADNLRPWPLLAIREGSRRRRFPPR